MTPATYTLARAQDGPRPESSAELSLALACLLVALGGVLLGLQVDGRGHLAGTGHTALAIGALVALVVTFLQHPSARRVPRDAISMLSAAAGFAGLAFVVSGALAPGGPWMFAEVVMLLWLLARRKRREETSGPELLGSSLFALAFLLLFRLWITWKGCQYEWDVVSVDVPLFSWIPLPLFDPVKTISLGSFTPEDLGLPATGLSFPLSATMWSVGFALCASGLWWRRHAELEHENDRIQATIATLSPELAGLVERLLPEDQWYRLGLHGLPARLREKKLIELLRQRVAERAAFNDAFARAFRARPLASGFAAEVQGALEHYALPPGTPDRRDDRPARPDSTDQP